jgi:four helix bundle protein
MPAENQDIKARTFQFALRVIRLCAVLSSKPGPARRLSGQLLDAGTSVGSNVEEAYAGQSRADFISKYNIALKEARDRSHRLQRSAQQQAGRSVMKPARSGCHFLLFTFYFLLQVPA